MSPKMRACRSGNVSGLVLALGFAAFVAASTTTSHGDVFYVGDKAGWVGKPAESYNHWAARHHFKVADTLALLTSSPYATLFYHNSKIWLQEGVLLQLLLVSVAIDLIFATQIVSWL
ncbi:unnamed protein product [Urochloa humidicola]